MRFKGEFLFLSGVKLLQITCASSQKKKQVKVLPTDSIVLI